MYMIYLCFKILINGGGGGGVDRVFIFLSGLQIIHIKSIY